MYLLLKASRKVIKNSLSFYLSLSLCFPHYLPATLRIVIFEVWWFVIRQEKKFEVWQYSDPILRYTQKCCRIKNRQTSKCRRFVIRRITQTETETEAVRSHPAKGKPLKNHFWLRQLSPYQMLLKEKNFISEMFNGALILPSIWRVSGVYRLIGNVINETIVTGPLDV